MCERSWTLLCPRNLWACTPCAVRLTTTLKENRKPSIRAPPPWNQHNVFNAMRFRTNSRTRLLRPRLHSPSMAIIITIHLRLFARKASNRKRLIENARVLFRFWFAWHRTYLLHLLGRFFIGGSPSVSRAQVLAAVVFCPVSMRYLRERVLFFAAQCDT